MNIIEKIRDTEIKLRNMQDPVQQMEHWALLVRLLSRMPVDKTELKRVNDQRDSVALNMMISKLEHPDTFNVKEERLPEYTQEELNEALRAFRHRMKFMKLDKESKISQREVTTGKPANIGSIQPPPASEFDPRIWKALVKVGMLVEDGRGFYREPL